MYLVHLIVVRVPILVLVLILMLRIPVLVLELIPMLILVVLIFTLLVLQIILVLPKRKLHIYCFPWPTFRNKSLANKSVAAILIHPTTQRQVRYDTPNTQRFSNFLAIFQLCVPIVHDSPMTLIKPIKSSS